MEILASQVRKGDYVDGFGTVDNIRKFYRERAVKGASANALSRKEWVNTRDNLIYARVVAEQQEKSYDNLLDNVVLVSSLRTKTFAADAMVKVYRVFKEAV